MVRVTLLVASASLFLLAGAETAPSQSTSEPLTITSLAGDLADVVAGFRATVANSIADEGKKLIDALGVTDAIQTMSEDLEVLDGLKDKAVSAMDDMMDFFNSSNVDKFTDEIDSLTQLVKPIVRTFSGQCNSSVANADRRALLQEAQEGFKQRRTVRSQQNSNSGPPLFTVTIGFSATYTGFFEPTVGLGWSVGIDTASQDNWYEHLLTGLGLGWSYTSTSAPAPRY